MMQTPKAVLSLRIPYIIGLSVIALLVTASYISMQRIVSEQRNFSHLVNLAGHQSGLANRIAHFGSLMATTDDESEFQMARAQLGRTINKMDSAHKTLRQGGDQQSVPVVINENLRTIYEDPMVGLDAAIFNYLDKARQLYDLPMEESGTGSVEYIFLTTFGPHVLEPMLDAAVDEYEKMGREAILRIENLEMAIWIATLITLLLEALFIFRPFELRIRNSMRSLRTTVSELTTTRERLLTAQELALIGDWYWHLPTNRISCSDQVLRIFGVQSSNFAAVARRMVRQIHPEDRAGVLLAYRHARDEGVSSISEYRVILPDSSERRVVQHIVAHSNDDDRITALSGTLQDVTERQELVTRLEKLSEQIPGCLYQFHLNPNGATSFPYASKGMEQTYGLSPEQAKADGGEVFAKIHHDDVLRVKREMQISSQILDVWRDEYRVIHPQKGEIWVEGHATPERLPEGGTLWHGFAWDITERKYREEQIRRLALYDALTGLANRRLLKDRITQAMASARRESQFGAVLMLDLDNFKTLNDTQGHSVGDALLVEVGKRLMNCIRACDTVARLGGDEFITVLEDLGQKETEARETACEVAEKIRIAVGRSYALGEAGEHTYRTSVSVGVTLFQGGEQDGDELIKEADIAMFQAKDQGRDRVCFFSHLGTEAQSVAADPAAIQCAPPEGAREKSAPFGGGVAGDATKLLFTAQLPTGTISELPEAPS